MIPAKFFRFQNDFRQKCRAAMKKHSPAFTQNTPGKTEYGENRRILLRNTQEYYAQVVEIIQFS